MLTFLLCLVTVEGLISSIEVESEHAHPALHGGIPKGGLIVQGTARTGTASMLEVVERLQAKTGAAWAWGTEYADDCRAYVDFLHQGHYFLDPGANEGPPCNGCIYMCHDIGRWGNNQPLRSAMPAAFKIATVREPLARAISHARFHGLNMTAYLEGSVTQEIYHPHGRDHQTVELAWDSGLVSNPPTKENGAAVAAGFDAFIPVEHFDEAVVAIFHGRFGLPKEDVQQWVSPKGSTRSKPSAETLEIITKYRSVFQRNNQADQELYKVALAKHREAIRA